MKNVRSRLLMVEAGCSWALWAVILGMACALVGCGAIPRLGTAEEKAATRLSSPPDVAAWGGEMGLHGSVQLWRTAELGPSGPYFRGPGGQAALMSSDGYALTVGHVAGVAQRFFYWRDGGVIHPVFFAPKDSGGVRLFLVGPGGGRSPQLGEVEVGLVRVVHRFPEADAALLKLEPPTQGGRVSSHYLWAPQPLARRATEAPSVWLAGNPIAGGGARGQILSVRGGAGGFEQMTMSLPVRTGDSGSALLNDQGQFLGLLAQSLRPVWGWGKLRAAGLAPSRARVQALIRRDRAAKGAVGE